MNFPCVQAYIEIVWRKGNLLVSKIEENAPICTNSLKASGGRLGTQAPPLYDETLPQLADEEENVGNMFIILKIVYMYILKYWPHTLQV